MTPLRIQLPTRRSTLHLAARIATLLEIGDLVILSGALGAGKTFLVRGIARKLGLPAQERVTSPTFALVQQLDTSPPITHADVYRLNANPEVAELGLNFARDESIVIAEWAAPFIQELGGDALVVELNLNPRVAVISATGTRSTAQKAHLQALLPLPQPKRPLRANKSD